MANVRYINSSVLRILFDYTVGNVTYNDYAWYQLSYQ